MLVPTTHFADLTVVKMKMHMGLIMMKSINQFSSAATAIGNLY